MNKVNIDKWLRTEAENLEIKKEKICNKIKKIMKNEDISSLDKMNQYNVQLRELQSAQTKLYEMIGRISEIKGIED
ncbi:hypothetical protein EXM90_19165 [Clostridium botulinum]|uniref:hypothetical protein n=1 Tax=Clostridium botulinum TaxID=1491 RepID=UPI0004645544|nr:hypothetical protein [Clostridium botulinum]APR02307.1 hypothetical protein RSJ2_3935 [Clostridium botulinum]MBN3352048.1 hypothetical protein [Clostridium botulinum]MBN3367266.1 hypothetical protein [Clostridium botulinum]MBN3371650.1 hypothetical protein [Clostridium botulinum]MBN3375544.1 hypothetical protein [Clostridium botulinum]